MCRTTNNRIGVKVSTPVDASKPPETTKDATKPGSSWSLALWPLHPYLVLALIPLCPQYFFIGRGYTQWFHWTFIYYFLTGGSDYLRRFLVFQGAGVCAGWYAAVINDWYNHGRYFDLLYNNMPPDLRTAVRDTDGNLDYSSPSSLKMMAFVHCLDILFHPLMTYVAWWLHKKNGGTLRSLIHSWDALVGSYALCRFYSWLHAYVHQDRIDCFWYFGFDVYVVDDLDAWLVAHWGETVITAGLGIWKLYLQWTEPSLPKTTTSSQDQRSSKPGLIQSESCISTYSSSSQAS